MKSSENIGVELKNTKSPKNHNLFKTRRRSQTNDDALYFISWNSWNFCEQGEGSNVIKLMFFLVERRS